MEKIIRVLFLLAFIVARPEAESSFGIELDTVAGGNDHAFLPERIPKDPSSKLAGKAILFLGSSVTLGLASEGNSFVDYLSSIDSVISTKSAVSGTTMADRGPNSYVRRLRSVAIRSFDAVVCQLSTNDATFDVPVGTSLGKASDAIYDTKTTIGAIEYITAYCRARWRCPVLFYTSSRYPSQKYGHLVEILRELQVKWQFGLIDLWNDEEFNEIGTSHRKLFMADDIHPTMAGYLVWWTPKFRSEIARAVLGP